MSLTGIFVFASERNKLNLDVWEKILKEAEEERQVR